MQQSIEIYTDGSCNPKQGTGAWAALIFADGKKIILQNCASNTTHNRMELTAVINSIEFVLKKFTDIKLIKIYTDSQYVAQIPSRASKLLFTNFIAKGGNKLHNSDLIRDLISLTETIKIEFIKIKAHQKNIKTPNYNREVDKLSRKIVREQIK